jgi:hypothetical protein
MKESTAPMVLLAAAEAAGQSAAANPEAASTAAAHAPTTLATWLKAPWMMPEQADLLVWCRDMNPGAATLLIGAGVVYLLFGLYLFKWLVTLNAAFVGAYLGSLIGRTGDAAIAGAFMGGFSAAAATWPLMKWAVTVMGGLFGALLGVSLWRAAGLDPHYAWSGGLTCLIFFGMLSFIVFRVSIMTYTSLQGSVMLIFGLISLIYKAPDIGTRLTDALTIKPFILPAAIFIPAICGMFYQAQGAATPEAEAKKK